MDNVQVPSDTRPRVVNGIPFDETGVSSTPDPVTSGITRARGGAQLPLVLSSAQPQVRRSLSVSQHSAPPFTEIVDTNLHTKSLEFYGASSSVAFLRHVDDISGNDTSEQLVGRTEPSLASMLHNINFQPCSTPSIVSGISNGSNDRFYFRVGRKFLDAYFSNIHCIQPIFDEEEFLTRCEDLWFGKLERQPVSFVALYYATLSLGSLVMVWDEGEIYGEDRFSWSRKLFNQALGVVTQLGSGTDLEMVQCYYMMGKVCQHELNPHVAYLYSGQATRTALATGLNRLPYGKPSDPSSSTTAAKTWWAVYWLDVQTSFALGRPDSLGPDEYHTQDIPGTSGPFEGDHAASSLHVLQVVPCMVKLARIMRKVSLRLYSLPCPLREELSRATELDAQLEYWFQSIPCHLKSGNTTAHVSPLKRTGTASFVKKQSVVLMTRYYNLQMIIFGKSLTVTEGTEAEMATIRECQQKCIESANQAIDLIYDTFRNSDFFQTWWYNSTYILFAVSVLLTGIFRGFSQDKKTLDTLFKKVDRAIAILDVLSECVVARNTTIIIKRTLARAKKVSKGEPHGQQRSSIIQAQNDQQGSTSDGFISDHASDLLQLDDADIDWANLELPMDDSQQALFWVEWGHLLNDLGA
ncbi:hypothetical protein PENSOL_c118G06980 [Penicillium solitum]|uniref:Xylanolytic transcriptional activator regulatory domain-containing protein n=1 Tax=Penicillium solitum TaxID=60172 RepID=A0A1V6Q6R8_9EURO|nr:uncharacterized protein PENSOL_c118G06980 [Penicillium solitum]OQD84496.1 hypothetical protein PENSOL_c118G06980 [Penicillium solitum]